jgi:hypothetical protein
VGHRLNLAVRVNRKSRSESRLKTLCPVKSCTARSCSKQSISGMDIDGCVWKRTTAYGTDGYLSESVNICQCRNLLTVCPLSEVHSQICEFLILPIFFSFFAATGQLSGLSKRKIVVLFMTCIMQLTRRSPFQVHIAGADSEFSPAPACVRSYTVKPGDIYSSIAAHNGAPTLVSLYITFSPFTYALKYSFQIMCQNDSDQIDGGRSNLSIDEVKFAVELLLRTF